MRSRRRVPSNSPGAIRRAGKIVDPGVLTVLDETAPRIADLVRAMQGQHGEVDVSHATGIAITDAMIALVLGSGVPVDGDGGVALDFDRYAKLGELSRKQRDSEIQRRALGAKLVDAEVVGRLALAIGDAIKRHVKDPSVLAALIGDIGRILESSGIMPHVADDPYLDESAIEVDDVLLYGEAGAA